MKKSSLWMRICARFTDYSILFGIGHLISLVIPYEITALYYWILALAVPLIFIPVEALLLTYKGTTPGKALFGMRVKGSKDLLSFKEALKRALLIGKRPGEVVQTEPTLFRLISAYAVTAALLSFSILSQNIITNYTIGCERQQKVSGWLHFVSEEAGFRVSFPTKPKVEEKEVELPRTSGSVSYNEYKSQPSDVTYSVSYIDIPKKWSFVSSNRILKGVLNVVLKLEEGSELIDKEFVMHGEYPALNFHFSKGADEVVGRMIRVGQRLFKLTVSYPISLAEKPVPKEFIDSFGSSPAEVKVAQEIAQPKIDEAALPAPELVEQKE